MSLLLGTCLPVHFMVCLDLLSREKRLDDFSLFPLFIILEVTVEIYMHLFYTAVSGQSICHVSDAVITHKLVTAVKGDHI